MILKKKDYVRVKPDTQIETGEVVHNWAGQVMEVYPEEATCLVMLDAPTIDSFSDEYLLDCLEEGAEAFQYIFGINELEPHPRRDTDEELRRAIDRLVDRELKLEKEHGSSDEMDEDEYHAFKEEWTHRFLESEQYQDLSETQQIDAHFAVDTLMEYLYNYEGVLPKEWDVPSIKAVCLEWIPRKVSTEAEFFEHFGDITIAFIQHVGEIGEIDNAETLISAVEKVKNRIPKIAADPANWGMAKSMMMGAKDAGVDLSSEAAIDNYMRELQRTQLQKAYSAPEQPAINPYKHLGRNDKVTVRYPDGRVLTDVKFKKVMKDLQEGACELVE